MRKLFKFSNVQLSVYLLVLVTGLAPAIFLNFICNGFKMSDFTVRLYWSVHFKSFYISVRSLIEFKFILPSFKTKYKILCQRLPFQTSRLMSYFDIILNELNAFSPNGCLDRSGSAKCVYKNSKVIFYNKFDHRWILHEGWYFLHINNLFSSVYYLNHSFIYISVFCFCFLSWSFLWMFWHANFPFLSFLMDK